MCDDSREITVNSPLFVAFIASGKGSFIFLLCVFRDPLFALYANSALLLLLFSFGAVLSTTVLLPTNMVIIISLLKYYFWNSETTAAGWAIFTDSFYED